MTKVGYGGGEATTVAKVMMVLGGERNGTAAEDRHRCEEELPSPAASLSMHPAGPAGSQPASADDAMDVGVVHQILAPRREDCQEADFGAKMFGIGSHLLERFRRRPKQDTVHIGDF